MHRSSAKMAFFLWLNSEPQRDRVTDLTIAAFGTAAI
jgi:hypothetical protein